MIIQNFLLLQNYFSIPVATESVVKAVKTRLRETDAPLPEYLISRSVAGTTHNDIIKGIHDVTNGKIQGRFFSFYPKRVIDMQSWLLKWMKRGAVPIATLNLQMKQPPVDGRLADAWHHQMISGVSEKGVHLCNPIDVMTFEEIGGILCSDSILKIRLEDVILRYDPQMNLSGLLDSSDKRWQSMNVVDDVVRLHDKACKQNYSEDNSCEDTATSLLQMIRTEYLSIPAAYKSGITLFLNRDSEFCKDLCDADEFPC